MNDSVFPSINIRAMEPEDLDMLYKIENDPELWGVSNTNVPYSKYTLHDYIANSKNDIYADQQVRLMIETPSGGIVGMVDIVNFDPRHRRAEVGIVIVKQYREKGYAHAALQKLHLYAIRMLHLHQLYAIVELTNHCAISLFTSLGYLNIATIPQWLYDGTSYNDAVLMQKIL